MKFALPALVGLAVAALVLVAFSGGEDDPGAPRATTSGATAPADGKALYAQMGCGSCHTFKAAGSSGQIGPNLDAALANSTPVQVHAIIVDPVSPMPGDFGERMNAAELDALSDWLVQAASS
jgi:mono/diheme cytochrome c family protein